MGNRRTVFVDTDCLEVANLHTQSFNMRSLIESTNAEARTALQGECGYETHDAVFDKTTRTIPETIQQKGVRLHRVKQSQ